MNSPLFIDKTFTLKHLFNFLTLQECILNFSIMFEPSHLKSLFQNIDNVQQKKNYSQNIAKFPTDEG